MGHVITVGSARGKTYEVESSTLCLLLATQLETVDRKDGKKSITNRESEEQESGNRHALFASFQGQLHFVLALRALQAQHDLLRRLGLKAHIIQGRPARGTGTRHDTGRHTFLWNTGFV